LLTILLYKLHRKDSLIVYSDCIKVLKVASLLMLYASVNYFVVREGNLLLMGISEQDLVDENGNLIFYEIPLAFLFIFFTVVIPVFYMYFALVKKDRLLLWTGLAVIVFTSVTLKYRFSIMPVEQTLIFAGALICIISWYLMKYLKKHTSVLTDDKDPSQSVSGILNAEALLISQTMTTASPPVDESIKMGGGNFGGGGAGSNF